MSGLPVEWMAVVSAKVAHWFQLMKVGPMAKASRQCVGCGEMFFTPPSSNKRACGKAECISVSRRMMGKRHGESCTRLHNIWCGMKARGAGTKSKLVVKYYKHVSVCDEWQSYEPFRDWALANGYRDDLEIDRIDVTGDYCPSNCRWATRTQQMMNTRTRTVKNKTSRYKGVQYMPHCKKKWRAIATVNKKPFHIGLFETEEEAAKAYDNFVIQRHGEFCNPNFKHGGVSF